MTQYIINISLECLISGDSDPVSEFYGNFSYRPEGQSSWITLVETSDSAPWVIQDATVTSAGYYKEPKCIMILNDRVIDIPATSKSIEVKASIKEYDPTIFDADEDLGTSILSVPVTVQSQKKIQQGSRSTGQVEWVIDLKERM